MNNYLIIICCLLFCCCRSFKKIDKQVLTKDSVHLTEELQKYKAEEFTATRQVINKSWEGQQVLEIYSEKPFRLHPDSGLLAGAGYLKMKITEKGQSGVQGRSVQKQDLTTMHKQHNKNKFEVKEALKVQQFTKVRVAGVGFVAVVLVLLLLILCFYSKLKKVLF